MDGARTLPVGESFFDKRKTLFPLFITPTTEYFLFLNKTISLNCKKTPLLSNSSFSVLLIFTSKFA